MGSSSQSSPVPFVARWPVAAAADALRLRTHPGFKVCVDGAWAWLTGEAGPDDVLAALRRLRGAEFFTPGPRDELIAVGLEELIERTRGQGSAFPRRQVPSARRPAGTWQVLANWQQPAPPQTALPPADVERQTLRLVPGGKAAQATGLMVHILDLAAWADTAPRHRLTPLRFAVDQAGRALILGAALPPLAGRLFWGDAQVLVPCGSTLEPQADGRTVRAVIARVEALDPGDVILFDDHGWNVLPEGNWVQGDRSSIRASASAHGELAP